MAITLPVGGEHIVLPTKSVYLDFMKKMDKYNMPPDTRRTKLGLSVCLKV